MWWLSQLFFVIIVINCLVSGQDFNEVAFKKIGAYTPPNAKHQKFYWVPRHFKVQWVHARPICKAFGFDILSLDTLEEMDAVRNMCEQNRDMFGALTHIGGMSPVDKSSTEWYWVTTNRKISYNMPWANGQPDFFANNEWCLSLTKDNGFKYNDVNCFGFWDEKFICQSYESV